MRCVLAVGMGDSRYVINEIMNPTLARMGLVDRKALRLAVNNFRNLGPNSVVHVEGTPIEGLDPQQKIDIFTMVPTGEFILDNSGQS